MTAHDGRTAPFPSSGQDARYCIAQTVLGATSRESLESSQLDFLKQIGLGPHLWPTHRGNLANSQLRHSPSVQLESMCKCRATCDVWQWRASSTTSIAARRLQGRVTANSRGRSRTSSALEGAWGAVVPEGKLSGGIGPVSSPATGRYRPVWLHSSQP
jgi:hypothetical protein